MKKDLTVRVDWIRRTFCAQCSVTSATLIESNTADGEEKDEDDGDKSDDSERDIAVASAAHGCPDMPRASHDNTTLVFE